MQNRIIKFRAWDKKRECFIGSDYPDNWDDDRDECYCNINMMDLTGIENSCENPDLIVEQYTGLKDKSREVYQGDVYTWGVLTFPITIDDYHGYRFMFGKDQLVRAFIINGEYKGNIHEPPEGPKGKEDG